MKTAYIVTYDISDPKRLRKVHLALRGYGQPIQLSVFRCNLNERDRATLGRKLEDLINDKFDQVLFIRLGKAQDVIDDKSIEALGRPLPQQTKAVII